MIDTPLFAEIDRMAQEAHSAFPAKRLPRKRVQVTSIESYKEVIRTLPFRERAVLTSLGDYIRQTKLLPTAYELFEWMKARKLAFDLNSVRPRINELCGVGLVRMGPKKKCNVTGRKAYTWELPPFAKGEL